MTMSGMSTRVYNPSPVELVYTEDGQSLSGHSHGQAPAGDPLTARLLKAGRLIIPATTTSTNFVVPDPELSGKKTRTAKKEETK